MRTHFEHQRRRGAQAIEFALTLPILLVIVAGTVDFGWYFHHRIVLTDATAQAAKAASFSDAPATDGSAVGNDVWTASGLDGTPQWSIALSGTAPDVLVTATSTATYQCLVCFGSSAAIDSTITHTAVHKYQD